MATVQNLLDACMVRYQDPDKTDWGDTELLAYCQDAVEYIHQLLINRNDISVTKSGTITTADGTGTYALADNEMSDFVAMYRGAKERESGVWIDDNFLFPVRQTESVHYDSDNKGKPLYYYLTSTHIGFLPVPDDKYTVSLLYFPKQDALLLDSTMPFNDVFNVAIKKFIDSMASARAEQDISSITQFYNELERQALGVTSARTPIKPRMVNRRR